MGGSNSIAQTEENKKSKMKSKETSQEKKVYEYYNLYSKFTAEKTGQAYLWPLQYSFKTKSRIRSFKLSPCGNLIAYSSKNRIIIESLGSRERNYELVHNKESLEVYYIVYSPNGKLLAACSKQKTIKLWNIEKNYEMLTLNGHTSSVYCLDFSPNSNFLLSGSKDKFIKIWNLIENKEEFSIYSNTSCIISVAYSPSSTLIASGSLDSIIQVLSLPSKDSLFRINENSGPIRCLSFSPDEMFLMTGSQESIIKAWNLTSKVLQFTLSGHSSSITCMLFSPTGHYLATGSSDKTVKIWKIPKKKLKFTLNGHIDSIESISFSSSGKLLGTSCNNTLKIWDLKRKYAEKSIKILNTQESKTITLTGHSYSVTCLVFSPCGAYFATGSEDQTIKVWNVEKKREEFTLKGHSSWVFCLSFSYQGHFLASGSKDHTVKVWDMLERSEEATLLGHSSWVRCLSYSKRGKFLASGSLDSIVKVWNVKTRMEYASFQLKSGSVICLAFEPSEKFLATGAYSNFITVWNLIEKKIEFILNGHSSWVRCLAFTPEGKFLASGSYTGLKLWNFNERREEFTFDTDSVECLAISYDGKTLATGEKIIKIWNIELRSIEMTFDSKSGNFTSLAFSPTSKVLASGSDDSFVRIWSLQEKDEIVQDEIVSLIKCLSFSPDGFLLAIGYYSSVKIWDLISKNVFTLYGHFNSINDLSFSPCGLFLATGSKDKCAKIWNLSTKTLEYTIDGYLSSVNCLRYSPNGSVLAIGSENIVKLWDPKIKKVESTLEGHFETVTCLSFLMRSTHLAVGSLKSIKIWDLQEKLQDFTIDLDFSFLKCLTYSVEANYLVIGLFDKTVRYYNISEKKQELKMDLSSSLINTLTCSPKGEFLAVGCSDGGVKVYTVQENTKPKILKGHSTSVNCICFSSDNNLIATASGDENIKIWNLSKQKEEFTINTDSTCQNFFSFSPNMKFLAAGFLNTVKVKNLNTKKNFEFVGHSGLVNCLAFTPDSSTLVTGSYDKTIKFWDVEQKFEVLTLSGYNSRVEILTFSPNKMFLVAGFYDNSIEIWNMVEKRKEIVIFYTRDRKIIHLEFTQDWKYLVSHTTSRIFYINIVSKLCFILDGSVSKCIKNQTDIRKLFKHAHVALFIYDYNQEYIKSKESLQDQLNIFFSRSITNFSKKKVIIFSKFLMKFAKIGIFPEFLSPEASIKIQEYFKSKVQILEKAGDYDELILEFFQAMIQNPSKRKVLACYQEKLKKMKIFKQKKEAFLKYFESFELKKILKIEEISSWIKIQSIESYYYKTHYFDAQYFQKDVLVKMYSFIDSATFPQMKTISIEQEKEAKCLEFLSQYSNEKNCFCQYYGCIKSNYNFYIVIKSHGINLLSFFMIYREQSRFIPNFNIVMIVKCLLNSFAFMKEANILHRKIDPSSFLIDEYYNVTIVNFLYAAITSDEVYEPQDKIFEKDFEDYRSPEENSNGSLLDIEKCDVYSLGLIFVQIVTLDEIKLIKNNIETFYLQIRNRNLGWLEKIIRNMMSFDPGNRRNFKELVDFIDADVTDTLSASVI